MYRRFAPAVRAGGGGDPVTKITTYCKVLGIGGFPLCLCPGCFHALCIDHLHTHAAPHPRTHTAPPPRTHTHAQPLPALTRNHSPHSRALLPLGNGQDTFEPLRRLPLPAEHADVCVPLALEQAEGDEAEAAVFDVGRVLPHVHPAAFAILFTENSLDHTTKYQVRPRLAHTTQASQYPPPALHTQHRHHSTPRLAHTTQARQFSSSSARVG
jgi:hypothetical protein